MRYPRYRLIGLAVAAALVGSGFGPASPARAAEASEWRTPLTRTAMPTQLVAASGDSILVSVEGGYQLSTDFGATFSEVDPGLGDWFAEGAQYVQDGWAVVNEGDNVVMVDLATGEGATLDPAALSLAESEEDPIAASSDTDALLWDGDHVVISHITGGTFGTPVDATLDGLDAPAGTAYQSVDWSVDHLFGYRTTAYTNRSYRTAYTDIDPLALDGTAGPAAFRATGELLHLDAIDATHLQYFTRTTSAVYRCVRDVNVGKSTCAKVRKVSKSHYPVLVQRQGDVVLLQDQNSWSSCTLSGTACTFGTVVVSKGKRLNSQYDAVGDPTRPLVSLSAGGLDPFYSLAANRTLTSRFGPRVVAVAPQQLSLAADRIVGLDYRPTNGVWQRTLGSDGFGAEKALATSGYAAFASAGRTAVDVGSQLAFFDEGRKSATGTYVHELLGFSGPYPLVDRGSGWFSVVGAVGVPLGNYRSTSGSVRSIFGTRVLTGDDCVNGSTMCATAGGTATSLAITDVDDSGYHRDVPLPEGIEADTNHVIAAYLWGDRVAATFQSGTDDESDASALQSAVYDLEAGTWGQLQSGVRLLGLGDGYAIRQDESGLSAWNFSNGQTYPLADATSDAVTAAGVDRLAYATSDHLVVRLVPGAGTSAPRVLGVVAAGGCNAWDCAWSPEVDATKALDAGRVVIRNGAGDVVRKLATPAAPDGSIRGVTWDGRLDDGSFADAGAFTWQLEATASDGTGAVTAIDGTSVPQGSLTVTRKHLGRVKFTKVSISDTTPTVDQELTASVSLHPADANLSYTWYAGSTVVRKGSGAEFASYTVGPADVGRKLKVVVAAEREGTYPASKTSSTTKAVTKARFSDTEAPAIIIEGKLVTAEVADWSPTATLAYQWYRVTGKVSVKIGTNAAGYTLTPLDTGARLKLVVTGSRPGYTSAATSATTDVVTYAD